MIDKMNIKQDLCEHGAIKGVCEICNTKKTEKILPEDSSIENKDEGVEAEKELTPIPDDWITLWQASKDLERHRNTLLKDLEKYRGIKPEWFKKYINKNGSESECISLELIEILREKYLSQKECPDGWMKISDVAGLFKRNYCFISRIAEKYKIEHEDWFGQYFEKGSRIAEYYSPELVDKISQELSGQEFAPEEWMTHSKLSKQIGKSKFLVKKIADKYRVDHKEYFKFYLDRAGKLNEHYSPELITIINKEVNKRELAPKGWLTNSNIARRYKKNKQKIFEIANRYKEDKPEWFGNYVDDRGRQYDFYSPELVAEIKRVLKEQHIEPAPEGWMTKTAIILQNNISIKRVEGITEKYRESNKEWFKIYQDKSNHSNEHYHPDLIKIIYKELRSEPGPPEGWMNNNQLAVLLSKAFPLIKNIADKHRLGNPEYFKNFRQKSGIFEFYSPELVKLIKEEVNQRDTISEKKKSGEKLKQEFDDFMGQIKEGKTIESQEFKKLINLFGGANAVDVLYQYRPEFKGLKPDYVKKTIGNYLGDFLIVKAPFVLEDLKENQDYLSEPKLKDSLIEIMKDDCMRYYNLKKKDLKKDIKQLFDPYQMVEQSKEIIGDYFKDNDEKFKEINNQDLDEVVARLQEYFQYVFKLKKSDNIVPELKSGRMFPDLNQLVNVKEIKDKQRMTIADEMGLGKSASVIIAKEYMSLKTALAVVPNNVISTWENYLSDKTDEDSGEQIGYFKKGYAPKIMTVNSPEELKRAYQETFDYILISQEKLNENYIELLENLNYDMLIIDEVHKLKNIKKGVRATNVLRLADKIEGEDKYLVALSGTPVPNKIRDLALLLRLMHPDRFGSLEKAEQAYNITISEDKHASYKQKEKVLNRWLEQKIIYGDLIDLRNLLKPRMQKKKIADSLELPELIKGETYYDLSPEEKDIYEILMEQDELTASQKIQILRQFLMNPDIVDATPNLESTKIKGLDRQLNTAFQKKDKVAVFVNGYIEGVIRGEKNIIDKLDLPKNVKIRTIEGEVGQEERRKIQEEFNKKEGKVLLFVSGQTADVGIDLSGGEVVKFYNEPWTRYDQDQQLARVYREGVKNNIESQSLIANNTIESGIHIYIEQKRKAIEKLIEGIPLTDIEKELVIKDEKSEAKNLEVNKELAEYYFSSWDKMMKIFSYIKEIGERDFNKFLKEYGHDYARCYDELGSRSYQSNACRVSGTIIKNLLKKKEIKVSKILDVASGPEMLKKHIADDISDNVYSIDINEHHFSAPGDKRVLGSFANLPVKEEKFDAVNLSFALHYTKRLSRNSTERLEVISEMNRVLKNGGIAVINFIYSLEFENAEKFKEIISRLGFKVVGEYSGHTAKDDNYQSHILTLEKVKDSPDIKSLMANLDKDDIKGLRFQKSKAKIKDTRKIVSEVNINGHKLEIIFNDKDKKIFSEETETLKQAEDMKNKYGNIKNIPKEKIINNNYVRFFNGKKYLLFRKLKSGSGAVIYN